MSGRRAKSIRGGRGEQVSRRRATVSNGGQRAVEERVETRDFEIGGDPIAPSHTSRLRRFLARPTVHLPSGRACPVFRLFPPPPLDPPAPVARSTTPPSPRALFTRVLDVRSSYQP